MQPPLRRAHPDQSRARYKEIGEVNEYNTRWIHPPYTTFFGSANFPSPKFGPSAFSAYHCRDYYLFSSWFSCLAGSNFSIKRCIAGDSLARPGLGPHRYLVANECPFRPLHSPTPISLSLSNGRTASDYALVVAWIISIDSSSEHFAHFIT